MAFRMREFQKNVVNATTINETKSKIPYIFQFGAVNDGWIFQTLEAIDSHHITLVSDFISCIKAEDFGYKTTDIFLIIQASRITL